MKKTWRIISIVLIAMLVVVGLSVAVFAANGNEARAAGTAGFIYTDASGTNPLSLYAAYGYFAGNAGVQAAWDALEASADDNGFVKVAEYRNGEFRRIGTNTCTWVDELGEYLKANL